MIEDVAGRQTRLFHVYRGPIFVLSLEDRPGTLHSNAAPGPGGPPPHPFIHAIAMDALSENELGQLLRQSGSFDEYLERLLAAGYDIASAESGPDGERPGARRISDASGPAGVLWPQSGQFTRLDWQPEPGRLVFPFTLTVYRRELAVSLLAVLQGAADFEELCGAFERQGFRLTDLP
jgi:hypothetical protein